MDSQMTIPVVGVVGGGVFVCQAEDGIRDSPVTGVQTCALPILGVTGDFVEVDQLLAVSDFVSLNAAVNTRTMHMIGQKELMLMILFH